MPINADGDVSEGRQDDMESVISMSATINELPESVFGDMREPLEGKSRDSEDYTEILDVHDPDADAGAPKKKIFRNGVEVAEL